MGSAHIYLALYVRLLTSILIDADCTDTACFEDNVKIPEQMSAKELTANGAAIVSIVKLKFKKCCGKKRRRHLIAFELRYLKRVINLMAKAVGYSGLLFPVVRGKRSLRCAMHCKRQSDIKNAVFFISPHPIQF